MGEENAEKPLPRKLKLLDRSREENKDRRRRRSQPASLTRRVCVPSFEMVVTHGFRGLHGWMGYGGPREKFLATAAQRVCRKRMRLQKARPLEYLVRRVRDRLIRCHAMGFTESARVQSHIAVAIQSFQAWEVINTRVLEELLRLVHLSSSRITGAALRTRRATLCRVERCALEDPG